MKILSLSLALLLTWTSFGQEMKYDSGKLFYDNVQITTKMAKVKSISTSMDASVAFKKAGVLRGWNVFWGIFGSYELIVGTANAASGYPIGFVDMGVGALSFGIIPGRELKRKMWMADGVKKYNAALQNK